MSMFITNSFLRKLILISLDLFLINFSIWLTIFFERDLRPITSSNSLVLIYIATCLCGFLIYFFTGQYKSVTRYVGRKDSYLICLRNTLLIFIIYLIGTFFEFTLKNNNSLLLIWILLNSTIIFSRFILRDLILFFKPRKSSKKIKVAIYGAGSAGSQLAESINTQSNYQIESFIDDDKDLSYRTIKGITIIPPEEIENLIGKIEYILLAIPSLSTNKYQKIFSFLCKYNLKILRVPSLEDLTSGRAKIDTLKPISIEDLLSRKRVPPKSYLLCKGIEKENICITGAAGSIGSELASQIIKLKPNKLVLIDHNENGLYNIINKIEEINNEGISVKTLLFNLQDDAYLEKIFNENKISKVFHAAAYKHVTLVESNPIQGILNNVFSTKSVCDAAKKSCVKQILLVSSDKAVRPTNIMGVSKRISELIIQAYADEENKKNINSEKILFSMVRFGNVLNSSGSVVPLFKKQIANGGPITLTHEKVVRFFMTIQEAAELLIQSSSLAKGGDLFLLDMGEPVLIKDLAKQMIKLSGLKLKNDNNGKGDIEIICTGLRSGEKLYEELLIDSKSEKTLHPLIYKANEKFIKSKDLFPLIEDLHTYLIDRDMKSIYKILKELVPEWQVIN